MIIFWVFFKMFSRFLGLNPPYFGGGVSRGRSLAVAVSYLHFPSKPSLTDFHCFFSPFFTAYHCCSPFFNILKINFHRFHCFPHFFNQFHCFPPFFTMFHQFSKFSKFCQHCVPVSTIFTVCGPFRYRCFYPNQLRESVCSVWRSHCHVFWLEAEFPQSETLNLNYSLRNLLPIDRLDFQHW